MSRTENGGRVFVLGPTGWLGAELVTRIERAVPVKTARVMAEGADYLCSLGVRPNDTLVNASGSKEPEWMGCVNVGVVQALVSFAEVSGTRLVQLGSAAEYGLSPRAGAVRESDQASPETPYGESKQQATELVRRLTDRGVVLRLFNIASAHPQRHSPLEDVLNRTRVGVDSGRDVELQSAETVRDWVSREFVVNSVGFAANHLVSGVYNISSGVGTSMRELVCALLSRMESPVGIRDLAEFLPTDIIGDPQLWESVSGLREQVGPDYVAGVVLPDVPRPRKDSVRHTMGRIGAC